MANSDDSVSNCLSSPSKKNKKTLQGIWSSLREFTNNSIQNCLPKLKYFFKFKYPFLEPTLNLVFFLFQNYIRF